ncbi:hypothetical protein Ahy_A03g013416 [Arachis hypogaea]|uniref:Protein FAR1-RELATED SEQUENCE n=1 Tax=Arachis hypogaea TaxID=3818 RepID=A0A445DVE7_ARAHY|nr:hypothetical protein Ahy_A03g013416 [Arachis hypogaea]
MQYALGYTVYEVVEQVCNSTFYKFAVTYDAISSKVKCQYLLFESRGILFHHSLSALSFEGVNKVSPRYLLELWNKNNTKPKAKKKCLLSHDDASLEHINEIQSLPWVRIRGCTKNRLGSNTEKQITNSAKKKKKNALSKLNLFYGGSVVQSNSSHYHGHIMNDKFRDSRE